MSRQITRCCQILFYVSCFPLLALDESNLGTITDTSTKTYAAIRIQNLKKAVKPRSVKILDTANLREKRPLSSQGILFTIKNTTAKNIFFVSDADDFKSIPMRRNRFGVWYLHLVDKEFQGEAPSLRIRYKFQVDGMFVTDSTHQQTVADGSGGEYSVYYLTDENQPAALGTMVLKSNVTNGQEVLFRIKNDKANRIALVGNFNYWNAEADLFEKKPGGFFELRKILPPGDHVFLYKIDENYSAGKIPGKYRKHPIYGRVNALNIK